MRCKNDKIHYNKYTIAYVKRLVSAVKQVFPVLHNSAVVLLSSVIEGWSVVRWCWVNFQCRHGQGVLLIWIRVGQGPTALAVGADGGCLDIFHPFIIYLFFLPLSGDGPI